jgi:hypothetical protein
MNVALIAGAAAVLAFAVFNHAAARKAYGVTSISVVVALSLIALAFGANTSLVLVGLALIALLTVALFARNSVGMQKLAAGGAVAVLAVGALTGLGMHALKANHGPEVMGYSAINYDGRAVLIDDGTSIRPAAYPTGTGTGQPDREWLQDLRANPTSNFVIEGLLTQEQIRTLSEQQQVVAARAALLVHSKTNVFLLTTSAKAAGIYDGNVNDVGHLLTPADGNGRQYLSETGQELWQAFAAFANDPATVASLEDVNPDWINTGFSEGGVSQSQGITGDLKALVLRRKDEKHGTVREVKVLVRCANPALPPKSEIAPTGHTDEQPPRQPTPPSGGAPPPEKPQPPTSTSPVPPTPSTSTSTTKTTTKTTETTTTGTTTTKTTTTKTTPSTTVPTTSTTPSCPPEHPDCKDPDGGPPTTDGQTPNPAPSGEPETTVPMEPDPIDPGVPTDAPAPGVGAPGATNVPTAPRPTEDLPAPVEPAPEPTNPGVGSSDPDGVSTQSQMGAASAPAYVEPAPAPIVQQPAPVQPAPVQEPQAPAPAAPVQQQVAEQPAAAPVEAAESAPPEAIVTEVEPMSLSISQESSHTKGVLVALLLVIMVSVIGILRRKS